MNICFITSWFPSRMRPNIAPFIYNFARNLGKSGVTVSIITALEEGDKSVTRQDHMIIYRIKAKFPPLFSMFKLINYIKPDIIHVHAPNFFSSNAIIVAKLKNIPIIATVHRAEVDVIGKPLFLFRKYALARFQKIIAVSHFTKSLALKAGADEKKISVIYNSCDETLFFYKDKFMSRKKHNLPIKKKIILFVGNLIKLKGLYTLIESLRILLSLFPDFLVIIIGQGEEQEKLESLVNEYGLIDNVMFLGWLPQKELSDFYNAADIFVLPSIIEGHSIALLEAMVSGLPIVASNIEGNKESIQDGVNGLLFETSNEKMLAEKLAIILSDSNLQQQMSMINPNIYFEKFSTRSQIENYSRLYRSLIGNKQLKKTSNLSTILLIDNIGLSHYTSYLACGLARYRDIILYGISEEYYVITGAAKEKRIKFYHITKKLCEGTSMISIIAARPFLWFSTLFRALTKTKYDIVHIQGHLPMFFLFLPLLKLKAKQICWTIHDIDLRPSSKGIRGMLEILYVNAVTQPTIVGKYADTIIVHGSLLKKKLTLKGVDQNKIYVIPIFDYRYLLNSNNNKLTNSNNDSILSKDYILLFGSIKPYKGIDVLINAVKIIRKKQIGDNRFNILIAGRGDTSYFERLLTKEDYEYIHIRNEFIPNSEIPDLFRKAKFVVLPYTDASQSGVLSLAYTFSKPVIVSNTGSIGEYVEHGKTGFIFEPGDITQLADYIIELIENNNKCIEMGKKAYQKMLQEMSLERCAEDLNGLYKRH